MHAEDNSISLRIQNPTIASSMPARPCPVRWLSGAWRCSQLRAVLNFYLQRKASAILARSIERWLGRMTCSGAWLFDRYGARCRSASSLTLRWPPRGARDSAHHHVTLGADTAGMAGHQCHFRQSDDSKSRPKRQRVNREGDLPSSVQTRSRSCCDHVSRE